MEHLKKERYQAYQSYSQYLLPYDYPLATPKKQLRLEDELMLTSADADSSQLLCQNFHERTDFWVKTPEEDVPSGCSFLLCLGTLCLNSKIRECSGEQCHEIREKMENTAPDCRWKSLRKWAIQAMACQQSFSHVQKLSLAHTHLVNSVFGCYYLAGQLQLQDSLYRAPFLGDPTEKVELADVCNIIFWMVTVQHEMGLYLGHMPEWNNQFIPKGLVLPQIREALLELQTLKICKHRIWSWVDLSERKEADLPDIIRNVRSHPFIRHDGHDLCTQTQCQAASIDSTKVNQLHKCHGNGCGESALQVQLLPLAVHRKAPTAWLRDKARLIHARESYAAISHVWSDGTGIGGDKLHGTVNSCLFEFFARAARELECDGIWWDTISIPNDAEEKSIALRSMHDNYDRAKCTIVHDLVLLQQEWTDGESACTALILSPWFARGWTSLELAMSHKVKVLFKGSDPMTPDVRDLDEDILASGPGTSSRGHWMASCLIRRIRRLRDFRDNLSDILAILRSRATSWLRDRPIIASLLAGVPNPDFSVTEGKITQRLITHIGTIDGSFILHGCPTMTESGGFSWCPATLDGMPINVRTGAHHHMSYTYADELNDDDRLGLPNGFSIVSVHSDGSLVDRWHVRPVNPADMKLQRLKSYGSDISVVLKIESALLDWETCLVLYRDEEVAEAALLVTTVGIAVENEDDEPVAVECRYVGAVRDHRRDFRGVRDSKASTAKIDSLVDRQDHGEFTDCFGNPLLICPIRLGKDGGKSGINSTVVLNRYLDFFL